MSNGQFPLVSIITPTFNSSQFISRTLTCVAEQSYANIEHIIVDGGSRDGTVDILRAQNYAKWISEPDNGMYDAINKGLRMACGDILAYLNSDDLYFKDTVQRVVHFFSSRNDADLVYSNLHYVDEHERTLFIRKYPQFSWRMFTVLDGSTVPQQTCFWRRRVLESVGYFDTSFRMAGDFEFLIRVGKSFVIQKMEGAPLAQFRFHSTMQTLNRQELNNMEIDRIHKMYGFSSTAQNLLLKTIATLRYKMWNLHRLKDKAFLFGKEVRYRP